MGVAETTADGRRFIGYGKTIAEAKEKCQAKAGLAEKGIDPKAAKQTVGHYLDWWLADIVVPKLAPKTIKAYRRYRAAPPRPRRSGQIELGKLTAQHVTTMLRNKERAGLSPRSVAMIREVLRGALNVASRCRWSSAMSPSSRPHPGKSRPSDGCSPQTKRGSSWT